jgi:hypothetical protein
LITFTAVLAHSASLHPVPVADLPACPLMSGRKGVSESGGHPEWTPEAEMKAFSSIPCIDTDEARRLLPSLVAVCELVGNTQSIGWNGACLAMCTCVAQLSPRDMFELCESIETPGSLWTALLHPGSVNTSGLLKVVSRAMEIIYERQNQKEVKAEKEEHDRVCERLKQKERDEGRAPEKLRLPPLTLPDKRKGLAGGGSLAAAGYTASRAVNRDAMTAVEPELDGILNWLMAEFAFDSAVPAKLWDGTTWDRPVMQQSKSFTMWRPFFSFCAGGHLWELLLRLMRDIIGLRQRLTVVYARPLFMEIAQIRAACQQLPDTVKHKPAPFVAALLFPLLAISLKKEAESVEAEDLCEITLGTTYVPSIADGAAALVDAKFDARNKKQEGCYLVPETHHLSKYHGKLKTKYDRMILGLLYLNTLAEHYFKMKADGIGMMAAEYVTKFSLPGKDVPIRVVQFCYLLADHCEMTWAKLDLSRSMEQVDVDETTLPSGLERRDISVTQATGEDFTTHSAGVPGAFGSKRRRVLDPAETIRNLKSQLATTGSSLREEAFNSVIGISAAHWHAALTTSEDPTWAHVAKAAKAILAAPDAWVYYSDRETRAKCKQACPGQPGFCALAAAGVLTLLGLGKLVLSDPTSGGGKRFWYFVKRPLEPIVEPAPLSASQKMADCRVLVDVLSYFGYGATSTPSLAAYIGSTTKETNKPGTVACVIWEALGLEMIAEVARDLAPPGGPVLSGTAPTPGAPQEDLGWPILGSGGPEQVSQRLDAVATAASAHAAGSVDVDLAGPRGDAGPQPFETSITYSTVPTHEAAFLSVVVTPAIGSCIYTCIALSRSSTEAVYEWNCVSRHPNGVAQDMERAAVEKAMAHDIASVYLDGVDAEHTPSPSEYPAIAAALDVTLDIHMLYAGDLVHFLLNPGAGTAVKLMLCGSGGETLTDCQGHFDFLFPQPPELGHGGDETGHGGFGT